MDGLAAANFTDPHNQRIIYLAVGGLLLLAVIVAVGTIVWWRSTKAEHPALAPLEVMSTRKFEKSDYTDRKRVLDEGRPPGHPTDADDDAVSDVVDLQAASEAPLPDPAELADPEHPIPSEGPTPEAEVPDVAEVPHVHDVHDAVGVSEEPVAVDVASPDDATVATELPVAAPAQPIIVAE